MTWLDYQAPIVVGGSFTWAEYALLRAWHALAVPTAPEIEKARFLFTELQKLRQALGKAMVITSGARTAEYTRYLRANGTPAAPKSAHNTWEAVDITVPGMSNKALWEFCHTRWPGRMEQLRYTPTWVHLDTREWGKRLRFVP